MNKKLAVVGAALAGAAGLILLTRKTKPSPLPNCDPPCPANQKCEDGVCVDRCSPGYVWITGQGCSKSDVQISWTLSVPAGVTVSPQMTKYPNGTSVTLSYSKAVRWWKNGVALDYGKFLNTITFALLENVTIRIEEDIAPTKLWVVRSSSPYMNIAGTGVVVDPTTNYVMVPDQTIVQIGAWATPEYWIVNGVAGLFPATRDGCGLWHAQNPITLKITKDTIVGYQAVNPGTSLPQFVEVLGDFIDREQIKMRTYNIKVFVDGVYIYRSDWANTRVSNPEDSGVIFLGYGCPNSSVHLEIGTLPGGPPTPGKAKRWRINSVWGWEGQQSVDISMGQGLVVGYEPA